jgi:hypothetical protein
MIRIKQRRRVDEPCLLIEKGSGTYFCMRTVRLEFAYILLHYIPDRCDLSLEVLLMGTGGY